ncbi:hypothetical protein ACFXI8_27205 [Streptomyces niveus]|uniref:hypothetical protein n=1 Tax=Streptomyces niveus TaxID=193462 RepID=UPI0036BE4B59
MTATFAPGDRVQFWADEPELDLPAGTRATVTAVYDDIGDGVDVRLNDGRHFNTVATALDPITDTAEQLEV